MTDETKTTAAADDGAGKTETTTAVAAASSGAPSGAGESAPVPGTSVAVAPVVKEPPPVADIFESWDVVMIDDPRDPAKGLAGTVRSVDNAEGFAMVVLDADPDRELHKIATSALRRIGRV